MKKALILILFLTNFVSATPTHDGGSYNQTVEGIAQTLNFTTIIVNDGIDYNWYNILLMVFMMCFVLGIAILIRSLIF